MSPKVSLNDKERPAGVRAGGDREFRHGDVELPCAAPRDVQEDVDALGGEARRLGEGKEEGEIGRAHV